MRRGTREISASAPDTAQGSRILATVSPDEKIKDLYLHHVGAVTSQRAAGAEDAPFVLLELRSGDTGDPAYATLGAPSCGGAAPARDLS